MIFCLASCFLYACGSAAPTLNTTEGSYGRYRYDNGIPDRIQLPTTTTTTRKPTTTSLRVPSSNNNRASRSHGAVGYGSVSTQTLNWLALRICESHNDYHNKNNPKYRGGYQFSWRLPGDVRKGIVGTWESVGGHGDPADASPEEQDMRAGMLFNRDGRGQWPVCGRLL